MPDQPQAPPQPGQAPEGAPSAPPQQQQAGPPPATQPQEAQQPQAQQTADTNQRLVSNLQIATQALVSAGQDIAADQALVTPEDAEVIKNAIVAISRLSERVAASQAQAAPAVGAVPPPQQPAQGVGAPPQMAPGTSVQQPAT